MCFLASMLASNVTQFAILNNTLGPSLTMSTSLLFYTTMLSTMDGHLVQFLLAYLVYLQVMWTTRTGGISLVIPLIRFT